MIKNIYIIAKKEVADYFNSPMGYIIGLLFAFFANFMFVKDIFLRQDASMRMFFEFMPWIILFFVPAITMRSFSEEIKSKTIDFLLTLPIKEKEIVWGKFFGAVFVIGVCIFVTISVPIGLLIVAKLPIFEIILSYFGVWILASSMVGVGILISSLTQNQVVSYLVTVLILFFLLLLGEDLVTSMVGAKIGSYISLLSPMFHLRGFLRGILDVRSFVYYFSLIITTITFVIVNLKKRP